MGKERLDVLVTERGLAESRERAQKLILAGQVRLAGQPATKPGQRVDAATDIEVVEGLRYVSRGGEKLEAAFREFALDVTGRTCLDVGSSTGGFTDCLLQHGARRVYAVDVGKGLLHWKIRNDPRVVVKEGINARRLDEGSLPERARMATVDVSFISLTKILPAVIVVMESDFEIVTLIKPQFEAGRRQVSRGGVVRDEAVRRETVERIRKFGTEELGMTWAGVCESPLRGPAGNVEFLAYWRGTR